MIFTVQTLFCIPLNTNLTENIFIYFQNTSFRVIYKLLFSWVPKRYPPKKCFYPCGVSTTYHTHVGFPCFMRTFHRHFKLFFLYKLVFYPLTLPIKHNPHRKHSDLNDCFPHEDQKDVPTKSKILVLLSISHVGIVQHKTTHTCTQTHKHTHTTSKAHWVGFLMS